jgi:hypothetical protein
MTFVVFFETYIYIYTSITALITPNPFWATFQELSGRNVILGVRASGVGVSGMKSVVATFCDSHIASPLLFHPSNSWYNLPFVRLVLLYQRLQYIVEAKKKNQGF